MHVLGVAMHGLAVTMQGPAAAMPGDAVMAANRFANIVDELSDDPDDDSYSE